MTYQQRIGRSGEQKAVEYLSEMGYQLLEHNYSSLYGEIDIIALDQDMVVFVEVKTRTSNTFGTPEDSVTATKIEKLQNTALMWLLDHPEAPEDWRIDVISVLIDQENNLLDMQHFIDAYL